ncbi:MAG: mechanosensitive ion channel family protein [Gammaproteobacteria bacterium]
MMSVTNAIAFVEKNDEVFFNFKDSVEQFKIISKKLEKKNKNISLSEASAYIKKLDILQDNAKRCVALSESKLKNLDELLKVSDADSDLKLEQKDYQYLKAKKSFYRKHLSECRFFVYRSQESLVEYKNYVQAISAKRLLRQSPPFWHIDAIVPILPKIASIFALALAFLFSILWGSKFLPINVVNKNQRIAINMASFILVMVIITMSFFGFNALAFFIIANVWLTMGAFLIAYLIGHSINHLKAILDYRNSSVAQKVKKALGIKNYKSISELVFLSYLAHCMLVCMMIITLFYIWGASANTIDTIVDGFLDGFTASGLTIIPIQIFNGLFFFAAFLLLGRWITTQIAKRKQFSQKNDTQVAMASIVFYLFFLLSVLIALLIMGVNFTGLAIIAGALSVGAGLGLQEIVNNFVSGIILLLEKPIKSGDRVAVGGVEGFIKKIRLRSTQITTLSMEDVIVPNAELISNKVINYMFRDAYWRVACKVGVSYGSDTDLVKKILLEVAAQHPDVVQEATKEPVVLFRGFGESSLLFELWCVIDDVNKKFVVVSDLNLAIDAAFRKEKITIAFPQRDIHIKK